MEGKFVVLHIFYFSVIRPPPPPNVNVSFPLSSFYFLILFFLLNFALNLVFFSHSILNIILQKDIYFFGSAPYKNKNCHVGLEFKVNEDSARGKKNKKGKVEKKEKVEPGVGVGCCAVPVPI